MTATIAVVGVPFDVCCALDRSATARLIVARDAEHVFTLVHLDPPDVVIACADELIQLVHFFRRLRSMSARPALHVALVGAGAPTDVDVIGTNLGIHEVWRLDDPTIVRDVALKRVVTLVEGARAARPVTTSAAEPAALARARRAAGFAA